MSNCCQKVTCRRIFRLAIFIVCFAMLYFYIFGSPTPQISQEPNIKFNYNNKDLELQLKYNLMEEMYGQKWMNIPKANYLHSDCTIEYANLNKLQQDHPCVLRLIKKHYLHQPASKNIPYNLTYPEILDPSDGQTRGILRILRNLTNGFFIECGGYDGEHLSNTLFMERFLNWKGLLVEAIKNSFDLLSSRNRKAYISPVCLSTKPYPMQGVLDGLMMSIYVIEVLYNTTYTLRSSIIEKEEKETGTQLTDQKQDFSSLSDKNIVYKTQCFPLYSLLLAIETTQIDYFGLDVEGSEYKILKTIPWKKVNIKTLTVEWDHTPEGEAAISRLMRKNGFVKFGNIEMSYSREVVYIQDFLKDLRLYK